MDNKGMSKEEAFDTVKKELEGELKEAIRQSSSLYWNGTLGQSQDATALLQETSYKYMKMEERMANLLSNQNLSKQQDEPFLETPSAENDEALEQQENNNKTGNA